MDLSTKYMGLSLKNPLVASASPVSKKIGNIKKLEDAGASAVVMYSLFEEQIIHEQEELDYYLTRGSESFAEALTYFPPIDAYNFGPNEYLEHIRKAKETVDIPIIGSLNGVSNTGWSDYAKRIEEAGADAIELNIYYIPTDLSLSGADIENLYLENLKRVKDAVTIPVAMKLSPYFSAMANMAKRLDEAGANGLVLFNRFYQPDINLDSLEVEPGVVLSTSNDLRLPLRWVAILSGKIKASLAATTGIHGAADALKMIMAGADVTMLCATLLKNGIGKVSEIKQDMAEWMEKRGYESIEQIKGMISHKSIANPAAFERANYMKALNEFN
ncbi:dihydroorotate dehydrogenase-like protein [Candidatus Poribacteria bacterium]|nr:dihydroorotate dehydrogenase-like protein [Candidatus Poribacteria bacterium]